MLPRTISVICHNALISGFALNCRPVTAQVVKEVCRDFDFQKEAAAAAVSLETTTIQEADRLPSVAAGSPERVRTGLPLPSAGDLFAAIRPIRRRFF